MKRLVQGIFILLFPLAALSQKEYFIYLEADGGQAFFARVGDKTISSSTGGYLILPQLRDTTHTFIVGFPGNKWPEQRFTVSIRGKDHGYLLKNFEGKGWGLFDLQTMSVQMAAGSTTAKKQDVSNGSVSLFTEILSKAANDPSLREKPVFASNISQQPSKPVQAVNKTSETVVAAPKKEEPKLLAPDTVSKKEEVVAKQETKKEEPRPVAVDTVSIKEEVITKLETKKDNPPSQEIQKEDTVVKTADSLKSTARQEPTVKEQEKPVTLKEEPVVAKTEAGKEEEETAVNQAELKKESIEMPVNTSATSENALTTNTGRTNSPDYERSEVIKKAESSTTDGFGLVFIDKIADFRQDTIQIFIPNARTILGDARKKAANDRKFLDIDENTKAVTKSSARINCSSQATEDDFFRLRKKMAGIKDSESMINEARKEFKGKCFSVDQIRNLGNLFLNEAGKFQFYEAAYPNSSDKTGFTVLQEEFRDPYFVHRFKNLVD